MGGKRCSFPTVLPAWQSTSFLSPSSIHLPTHPTRGDPPELAPAFQLHASLELTNEEGEGEGKSDLPSGCATRTRVGIEQMVASLRRAPEEAALIELEVEGDMPHCPIKMDTSMLTSHESRRLQARGRTPTPTLTTL